MQHRSRPYNGHLRRKPLPSITDLRRDFRYDESSGRLFRVTEDGLREIGYEDKSCGYVKVDIRGACLRRSRIAFAIVYGRWPHIIDHINRDTKDDRLENIREVSAYENASNRVLNGKKTARPLVLRAELRIRGPYRHDGRTRFEIFDGGQRIGRRATLCRAWQMLRSKILEGAA